MPTTLRYLLLLAALPLISSPASATAPLPAPGDPVDAYLRLPILPAATAVHQLAIGDHQVCALLHGGATYCISFDDATPPLPPPPDQFAALTAGARHFCGLDATARPVCWGADDQGQLDAPTDLLLQFDAAADYTCAITAAAEPLCWGDIPGETPSGPFERIATAPGIICAVGPWEPSRCWGPNTTLTEPFNDAPLLLDVSRDLICGIDRSLRPRCFHSDGRVLSMPTAQAVDLAVGHSFACTLDPTGYIECVGPAAPDLSEAPPIAQMIDAHEATLCAVTAAQSLQCWDATGLILDY